MIGCFIVWSFTLYKLASVHIKIIYIYVYIHGERERRYNALQSLSKKDVNCAIYAANNITELDVDSRKNS